MAHRIHFLYMGAAWSVSESGFRFLMEKAEAGEPFDVYVTGAREIKRARPGTQPLVGDELRDENRSR
jgi:hypothetical protein